MNEREKKSRSRIKREMLDLQKMGERLVRLSAVQIDKMELPPELAEAVFLAQGLKKHGARHRQIQYIGALMRRLNPVPIQLALERLDQGQKHEAWAFTRTEQWRDRLVAGDDTLLEELIDRFSQGDRQQLRRLVLNARKEKEQGRPPKAARVLFRHLRTLQEECDPSFG